MKLTSIISTVVVGVSALTAVAAVPLDASSSDAAVLVERAPFAAPAAGAITERDLSAPNTLNFLGNTLQSTANQLGMTVTQLLVLLQCVLCCASRPLLVNAYRAPRNRKTGGNLESGAGRASDVGPDRECHSHAQVDVT